MVRNKRYFSSKKNIIAVLTICLSWINTNAFSQNNGNNKTGMIQAIQQFQLRPVIGTEKKARQTLQAVKNAGFEGIELNGFMIRKMPLIVPIITWMAGMPVGTSGKLNWKELVNNFDLKVVSIHEDLGTILKNRQMVIDEAKSYGTSYIVITGMFRYDYSKEQEVVALADKLNKAGKILADANVQLLYHNHNCEFQRVESGKTAFDILLNETDAHYVNFEFDSYWAIDAGCDAVQIMNKLGNRMKLWHVNDRGIKTKGKKGSILKPNGTELGNGNINLPALIQTAKNNGVEAIILETHKNWVDNSPVKSFQQSAEFLKRNL
jgi:Sugar phosphate isomerases/epimerases